MREVDKSLFATDIPFLDVRAPVEFIRGAFPTAVNLPILSDEERHQIGICYKQEGPDAAVRLGHKLVSGETKRQRVDAWAEFVEQNSATCLYCFRGGQRSAIAEQWLDDAGIRVPRIRGGYKAMRRFLLAQFASLPRLVVIAGKTGTGKTEFLGRLEQGTALDLEAAANHRGSAFGKRLEPQPSQIDFENRVAIDLLRTRTSTLFVEDESRMIGRITLPVPLQDAMKAAPLYLLEDSMANRVERIFHEYVVTQRAEITASMGDDDAAKQAHKAQFTSAIDAIQKRLGGERHKLIRAELVAAFDAELPLLELHGRWIEKLLSHYYDPMYEYQLSRKADRIIAGGTADELIPLALRDLAATPLPDR